MPKDRNQEALFESRLEALKHGLRGAGLDAFYLPLTDEFQNEYLPASAKRLEWLTGFTGSAGSVAVLAGGAPVFFTDGRYTLQAEAELPGAYHRFNSSEMPPEKWLAGNMGPGARIGYDPWLMTLAQREKFEAALAAKGIALAPLSPNPVDALWEDRPAAPAEPVTIHPLERAGEDSHGKRARLAQELRGKMVDAAVITVCDSVMWLLNIRGNDVPMTPFALSYAVLHGDASVDLFIAREKIGDAVRAHLGDSVRIHPLEAFQEMLRQLMARGKTIQLDRDSNPVWIHDVFTEALARGPLSQIVYAPDPCQLPKACKNAAEIAGARNAHQRDGLAVIRFLSWLDDTRGRGETIDELGVMAKLETFRQQSPEYRGPSFNTIAGAGANGAIVHYRADETSSRALEEGTLLLLDSGGQYPDGTTDITRTVALGAPAAQMREDFTRVLKGHIALARAVFPEGTSGQQLDSLARQFLWQVGLDYDHGTGHGVGSYLSVHEGPQRIGKKVSPQALQPGMILSNEPGVYRAGEYGIRIESLITVTAAEHLPGYLRFDILTLVPVDRALIEPTMLETHEVAWLDAYHAHVMQAHAAHLGAREHAWLVRACAPLAA